MVLLKSVSKITDNTMLYNILYTYEDKKDGYLIITVKQPHIRYLIDLIDTIDNYLKQFGNYKGVCFYLSPKSKKCKTWDFKTNLKYTDYMKKQDSGKCPES